MVIKVDVMTTDRERIWYEPLYVKLCWFECITMICGLVQVFQVVRLPKTEYTMKKFPTTQCDFIFHRRVWTLVLLGGVKEFPTVYPLKPGVMEGWCYLTLP
jgi:hypothetical protein